MRLRALRLADIRRFHARGVAVEGVGDGVNCLIAPNEAGKSTLFDALHALIFNKHSSKDALIVSLKPHAGGAPLVSADIDHGGRSYRIEKRFLGRPAAQVTDLAQGRVLARADEAQQWIDQTFGLGGGAMGPRGLLWVRQGAASDLAEGAAARADALGGVVAGELDSLTGGRRMTRMQDRTRAELAKLLTATGRAKTDGPLGRALAAVAALEAETTTLRQTVAAAAADLAALGTARRRLIDLADPDAMAQEQARLAVAEAAVADAARARAQTEQVKTDLALAQARVAEAQASLTTHTQAVAAARQRLAALAALEGQGPKFTAAATASAQIRANARAARDQADARAAQARSRLALARAAAAARNAAQTRAALTDRLAQARAADQAEGDARAAAQALALTQADIDALAALVHAVAEAEMALGAARTGLTVTYDPGAPAVLLNGAPLTGGVDQAITATATLDLPGIGRLKIRPGAGTADPAESRLARARKALADGLARLGCPDVATARARAQARAAHAGLADQAQARRDALAPQGLDALTRELAALPPPLDATDAPDLVGAEAEEAAAAQAARLAQADDDAAAQADAAATQALATHSVALRAETEATERALAQSGPPETWAETQSARAAAYAQATAMASGVQSRLAALAADTPDPVLLQATRDRLAQARTNRLDEIARTEITFARLTGSLGRAAEQGVEAALAEAEGRLETARSDLARLQAQVAALTRLDAALTQARATMRDRYFAPLLAELGPLLRTVFGPADIDIDEASLLPTYLTRAGQDESLASLSGGTREQLAVLTRLGFARLMAQAGEAPPVILDDALVFSDDDRIERMFDALTAQAGDLQILVLSCRQRAFQSLGGRMLHLADWTPPEF